MELGRAPISLSLPPSVGSGRVRGGFNENDLIIIIAKAWQTPGGYAAVGPVFAAPVSMLGAGLRGKGPFIKPFLW